MSNGRDRWWFLALCGLLWSFGAQAASAQQVWLGITSPASDQLVSESLKVVLRTMGDVARVEASVGTATAGLDVAGAGSHALTLSLAEQAEGPLTLTARAVTRAGVTTMTSVPIKFQRTLPLAVNIDSPPVGLVVRDGMLHIKASCSGDPTCTVSTSHAGPPAASIDTVISIAADEGKAVDLKFTATNSSGQEVTTSRRVYVESSPGLREILTVEGEVLAFDGERALVRSPSRRQASIWSLTGVPTTIHDGELLVVAPGEQEFPPQSHLRPSISESGALLFLYGLQMAQRDDPPGPRLHTLGHFWDGEKLTSLGTGIAALSGPWLFHELLQLSTPFFLGISARNLQTGDTWREGAVQVSSLSVASNGDAVWGWPDNRWRHGAMTLQAGQGGRATLQITDGVRVADFYANQVMTSTALFEADGRSEVVCNSTHIQPCTTPALNAGWAAYGAGPGLYFRRSPTGDIEQLTQIPAGARISDVTRMGEPVVAVGSRRHVLWNGATLTEVSSLLGRVLPLDRLYVVLGRSVFEIVRPGDPVEVDGGMPPASDAGATWVDAGAPSEPTHDAAVSLDAGLPTVDAAAPEPLDGAALPPAFDAGSHTDATLEGDAATPAKPRPNDGCSLAPSGRASAPWLLLLGTGLVALTGRARSRRRR